MLIELVSLAAQKSLKTGFLAGQTDLPRVRFSAYSLDLTIKYCCDGVKVRGLSIVET